MSSTVAKLARITEVSQEFAYEIAAGLTKMTKYETHGMLLFSGLSAAFGAIYIVIPPLGNSMLLPIANHAAEI